jgi:hypothetical protein
MDDVDEMDGMDEKRRNDERQSENSGETARTRHTEGGQAEN